MARFFELDTTITVKTCVCCGRELSVEKYPHNPRYKGGVGNTCTECVNAKKHATAIARQEREERMAAESAERKQRYNEHLAEIKPEFEERSVDPENVLASFSAAELFAELDRRGMANERALRDFWAIYRDNMVDGKIYRPLHW